MERESTSRDPAWKIVLVVGGTVLLIGSFLPWYYLGGNGFFIVGSGAGDLVGVFPVVTMVLSGAMFAAAWLDRRLAAASMGAAALVACSLAIQILESTKGRPCAGWCYGGPAFGWVLALIGGSLGAVGGFSAWMAPRLAGLRLTRPPPRT